MHEERRVAVHFVLIPFRNSRLFNHSKFALQDFLDKLSIILLHVICGVVLVSLKLCNNSRRPLYTSAYLDYEIQWRNVFADLAFYENGSRLWVNKYWKRVTISQDHNYV